MFTVVLQIRILAFNILVYFRGKNDTNFHRFTIKIMWIQLFMVFE